MSHVYSNSGLNLAAADSADGDIGCFFNDRPDVPNAWKIKFPTAGPVPIFRKWWQTPWDPPGLEAPSKHYTWNCISRATRTVIDDSVLASRAWTLQERLLAPRTLYFGRIQNAWECRESNAYEALPDFFDEAISTMSPGNFSRILRELYPLANEDNVSQWSEIVENYSRRSLTLARDKLVAISALARILAPVYGSDYIAGMWKIDLLRLLLWQATNPSQAVPRDPATIYRAPSWSWASVDCSVKFPRGFAKPLEGEDFEKMQQLENDPESRYDREPLARILGTHVVSETMEIPPFFSFAPTLMQGYMIRLKFTKNEPNLQKLPQHILRTNLAKSPVDLYGFVSRACSGSVSIRSTGVKKSSSRSIFWG